MESKGYHHGNLRLELIETAIDLINKEGLFNLSLRKIAALCQVSHAAPYSHFKNKRELLEAISDHISNRFTQIFMDILSKNNKDDPSILNKIGEAYFMFFMENPQYFTFLFYHGNPKIYLSLNDKKCDSFPAFQIFKDTACHIFKSAGMSDDMTENMIIIKWAFIHGFTSMAMMKGIDYDKDWKIKIKEFLYYESKDRNAN